jgi:hypothetical protein
MRGKFIAIAILASFSLTGCSAFVPSWNAQPTPIEIDNESNDDGVSEVPQDEPEPQPSEPAEDEQEPELEPEENEPIELESVNVQVVSAMVYEDRAELQVVAQVFDVVEDGGECTLKLLADGYSTEIANSAERSSSYTQCSAFQVPLSELPGGAAVVSVSYLSDNSEGESEAVSVVIP